MKPPPFEYHCPNSLEEALDLLAKTQNAKVLAGGQSLVPMLSLRYLYPDHIIDINRVPELSGVAPDGDAITIGAMTRQRALQTSDSLRQLAPIVPEAVAFVGHRQTRNRGTFGGSLCHLDPSGELPTVALLYDARIHVASAEARRSTTMNEFMAGYMTPAIGPHELVTHIEIRNWPSRHGYAFVEHARRHGDFAIASAGCLIELGDGREIRRVAISVGGLSDVPVRLAASEKALQGRLGDPALFDSAAQACLEMQALNDIHAGPDYRRSVAAEMVRRALTISHERALARSGERQ